jgi:hypothetical protein
LDASSLRLCNEAVDDRLKQGHRHASAKNDGIVETAQVVFRPQRVLGLVALLSLGAQNAPKNQKAAPSL